MTDSTSGLEALENRIAKDLTLLELPAKSWVPERAVGTRAVVDVIFVGAGMCGLAGAARLKLAGIDNIALFDASPVSLPL